MLLVACFYRFFEPFIFICIILYYYYTLQRALFIILNITLPVHFYDFYDRGPRSSDIRPIFKGPKFQNKFD